MRKLTGLNDRLEHFAPEDLTEEQKLTLPTYRAVILRDLATLPAPAGKPEEVFAIYDLGSKIRNHPLDLIEVDEKEFELISTAVRANGFKSVAHYQAQLLRRLQAWEKGE